MIPSTMYIPTYTIGRICYPGVFINFHTIMFYGTCVSYQIVGTNNYYYIVRHLSPIRLLYSRALNNS